MIIIDNNWENSDWIKSFGLDIPGVTDYKSFALRFSIPENEPERSKRLARFAGSPWLKAVDEEIRKEVEKAAKKILK